MFWIESLEVTTVLSVLPMALGSFRLARVSVHVSRRRNSWLGKEWREKQIRKITDKVFDRVTNNLERANLNFEDLYIAVLLVFNDINKHLPGPHFDPPSKDQVRMMIEEADVNLDGEINHEEFVRFIQRLTSDTFIVVSQGLILTLVVAPTVAMATKKTTEGVPVIGKLVQKLPNSVYASLVTMAVMLFQKSIQEV